MALAQENRANLVAPDLKPIVKWPAGAGPQVDWRDFDSLVRPWFSGEAFADRVGAGFWPLPEAEMLDRYDRASQLAYWTAAADHFDANSWLDNSAVSLERREPTGGANSPADCTALSTQAAELLGCNSRLRVLLPLEDGQLQLAKPGEGGGLDPHATARLLTAAATLVSNPPPSPWDEKMPRHWLRTDRQGLVPYFGAGGDERDVRMWAWLAFLRHLDVFGAKHPDEKNFIMWNSTLPLAGGPDEPAAPGELVWFYPGQWFGVDMPLATVQLKWLRRAQQDYEYLLLAQQRGEAINTLQLARLIAKPVELHPGQSPDPVYSLMTGTTSQKAWDDAHRLLADTILLHRNGQTPSPGRQQELYIRTLQLSAPQERPLLMGRSATWMPGEAPAPAAPGTAPGNWVDLNFSLDIYNASETTPDKNRLRWSQLPVGWEINPREIDVPQLATYHVFGARLVQKFNLDRVSAASREPMELQFINGHNDSVSPLKIVLPVAASDVHEGRLEIDGVLDEWNAADAIQDGPMVRMLNRPAVQKQELQLASTNANVYTCWGRENFYIGFSLDGLAPPSHRTQNFVTYEDRRAWGEDLCEILIQPLEQNHKLGSVLHVVVKPNGAAWVERKQDDLSDQAVWKPLGSAGVRYAATTPDSAWRGEVAIPWSAIVAGAEPPTLLRFNFVQHRSATGESASWAGPIDFGRNDAFMGLIYLRGAGQDGRHDVVRQTP